MRWHRAAVVAAGLTVDPFAERAAWNGRDVDGLDWRRLGLLWLLAREMHTAAPVSPERLEAEAGVPADEEIAVRLNEALAVAHSPEGWWLVAPGAAVAPPGWRAMRVVMLVRALNAPLPVELGAAFEVGIDRPAALSLLALGRDAVQLRLLLEVTDALGMLHGAGRVAPPSAAASIDAARDGRRTLRFTSNDRRTIVVSLHEDGRIIDVTTDPPAHAAIDAGVVPLIDDTEVVCAVDRSFADGSSGIALDVDLWLLAVERASGTPVQVVHGRAGDTFFVVGAQDRAEPTEAFLTDARARWRAQRPALVRLLRALARSGD